MLGDRLDLTSDPGEGGEITSGRRRKFLGVHFQCCGRYTRIYLNRQATAYVGYCPGCGQRVEFPIGPGGSDCRFFSVS